MKRFMSIVWIMTLFLSVSISMAQIKIKSLDEKMPSDSKVKVGKLSNGIVYYLRENKKPENRLELRLAIKAGSVLEEENQKGLAHFVEHMCFNGTKNFPKNELIKYLESTGMRFGADLNAYTSFDETVYMLQLPTDNADALKNGFQVLEDWAHNVSFDDAEIDKERGVIMEEWRLGKGAQDRVMKKQLPMILYKSRYAERLPIGDTNVINHHKYETLKSFYKDWYRPDLMAVVVVGDLPVEKMEEMVKAHFGNIKPVANPKNRTKYDMPYHKETVVSIATDKELPYSIAQIYFKYDETDPSIYGTYRENIKNSLLSSMLNARMQELSRKPDAPYMFAQSGATRFIGSMNTFFLVGVAKSDLTKTLESVLTESYRAYQHGFTASELTRAKEEVMTFIENAHKEKDKTESANYAGEYLRHYLQGEAYPGIDHELDIYKTFVPEITLDELNQAIKKFIHKENTVIAISAAEKPDVVVPTESEVLAMFDKVSNSKIEAYKDEVSDEPLFAREVVPGKITKKNEIKKLGVTEWTLSNGVKVVLKPTDFKNDEIQFRAFSPGGTSLASDADFLSAQSAAGVIDESGIGKFSANVLQKKLAGKNLSCTPVIGELTEGFYGDASPKDLEVALQLINLYFTEPRKDDEAFKTQIGLLKESIKNAQNDPDQVYRDSVRAIMAQYHFRSMPMTDERIGKIDLDKIVKFYNDRYADASDFTFLFVGAFDLATIEPLILKYLGSLPSINRKETWKDVGVKYPKGKIEKAVKKGIEPKSTVRLTISGDFQYNSDNKFALRAMTELFNIRLREVIREDLGGVYGIRAFQSAEKYPNQKYSVSVGFGCSPDRVEELIKAVHSVITELKEKPADEKNVNSIKEIMKREFEKNSKENRFWLNNLYESYFLGSDKNMAEEYDNYLKKVEKLTVKDFSTAANKYLKLDNFARIVLYPED